MPKQMEQQKCCPPGGLLPPGGLEGNPNAERSARHYP